MTYEFLQHYWWCLIALLGGLLVFLMFVQGANLHLGTRSLSDAQKRLLLNSTGRKWELTFTTLVTFGGAFFASFPLFYSTSFGGAYWVWVLLLISFVFQAVAYEFQHKKENLLGVQPFRVHPGVQQFPRQAHGITRNAAETEAARIGDDA